jgi:hypothetical protein
MEAQKRVSVWREREQSPPPPSGTLFSKDIPEEIITRFADVSPEARPHARYLAYYRIQLRMARGESLSTIENRIRINEQSDQTRPQPANTGPHPKSDPARRREG